MEQSYFYHADPDTGELTLRVFTDRKTFDDVIQVFTECRPVVSLRKHLELWLESERWAWFEDHQAWLAEQAELEARAEAVERARDDDGQFVSDDPDTSENEAYQGGQSPDQIRAQLRPEPEYVEPLVTQLKPVLMSLINRQSEHALKFIRDQYPDYEQLSWDKQEQQARAWFLDKTTETPLVDAIANARGIDKQELCQRIIAKANAYESEVGAVIGERQALEDRVVEAEDWSRVLEIISD
ncbi:hypothetical protein [Litoribrevibacter albus]|uniref:Uncharacterized protein n=1 Tax=Litoribrevibacter albus TaxID=1473156 RepID=A0AA37SBX1_9GAMM|nr:hypothetical protein [Litoribrevibacter albus]GLQ31671.1 hypothetical protein GCM10007876_21500 [Litoribrevibacter albus]